VYPSLGIRAFSRHAALVFFVWRVALLAHGQQSGDAAEGKKSAASEKIYEPGAM
jgi:hypothetical protein